MKGTVILSNWYFVVLLVGIMWYLRRMHLVHVTRQSLLLETSLKLNNDHDQ